MAKNDSNNRSNKGNKPNFQDFKFVNINLSKGDAAEFKKWSEANASDAFTLLEEMANSGYKQSATWSDDNDCYIVSHTCLDPKSANFCLIMSSRSDDLWEAFLLNLYKHYVMVPDQQWPAPGQTSNWG